MNAPQDHPYGGGLRVVGLPPVTEREPLPVLTFGELKSRQYDLQEDMLALVAFDPHLVEQMNLLLDQMHLVNSGFTTAVRADTNTKWDKRLESRVVEAHREGRRDALEDWVHASHPDEAIDLAAGRLVRLVLGWSGESGKAAKAALQALANLEGAWQAWATAHGLPVEDRAGPPAEAAEPGAPVQGEEWST